MDVHTAPAGDAHLYVYYRVRAADEVAFAAEARAMQASLKSSHPGLHARLLRRPELDAGLRTWMEAYQFTSMSQLATTKADVEAAALTLRAWIQGERHTEHFEPVEPCA